ncbi:MAG: serine hydrolase [Bryobacterales bacterium]|nr:serine hydrolase [Bryobacterales bacterium]
MSLRMLVLLLAILPAFAADPLNGFDTFVQSAMQHLQVPGAAVGVMVDGKVVLAKGYGVRGVNERKPVTPATLFATGSITKSFTATALASLVAEGKLDWDKPVREYLAWFRLYDPHASDLITVRDMLTHRSGLPRYDAMRFLVRFPTEDLIRRLRYLPPSRSFREAWQYNNLMYVVAGYTGAQLAGTSYEDLVIQRVFRPLGMTRSTMAVKETQKTDDYALPHLLRDGGPVEVPFYDYQSYGIGPNGAVNSTVEDLLRYLAFHLDGEERVLPRRQLDELHKPVLATGQGNTTYALGWNIDYRGGHHRIAHGGAITGFTASAMLYPGKRLAIIVLNNLGSTLPNLVAEELSDRFLGIQGPDRLAQLRAARPHRPSPPVAVPNTRPTLELAAYAGTYTHPALGDVRVETNGSGLKAVFSAATLALRHHHFDTFQTDEGLARFTLDEQGRAARLYLPIESAMPPLEFIRR